MPNLTTPLLALFPLVLLYSIVQVNEFGGRWFINPGSITGAYSALEADAVPSFILLAVQGAKCVTYVYELHGDQVEVSKSEFSKASA